MKRSRVSLVALWVSAAAFTLSACGGGGSTSSTPPVPGVTPTPIGTATPTPIGTATPNPQGVVHGCDAISSTTSDRVGGSAPMSILRNDGTLLRPAPHHADAYVPGLVAVTVRATGGITTQSVGSRFKDASVDREIQYASLGKSTVVLRTTTGNEDAVIASSRTSAGVEDASRVSYRFVQATPNDPYYGMQFKTSTGSWLGQWDMHFLRVASAFDVAQGTGVKVAIVDTGVDVTHPDLAGKIVRTQCFVTGATVSSGSDVSDLDGHGTNVAGIAAADTNNSYGFTSVGNAAQIMAYKVFPNPPAAGCGPNSTNPACGASSTDIALAINDAVANGAKVINLSLGGGTCTNGVDNDPTERLAISNALNAGVVVVAASGNSGATAVIAPACSTNVIAVGATSLNDTGSTQTSNNPQAYVSSYSNYDASNANWGIVAPGGDPLACETAANPCPTDYQHWIENIYSSKVPGWSCSSPDLAGATNDCRVLIAGTSQATPHVTGAAALVLSVSPGLNSAAMKTLLCSTTDPVTGTMLPANGTTKLPIASGCGALDVYRAVFKAKNGSDPGGTGNIGT